MRKYKIIVIIFVFMFCFSAATTTMAATDEEEILQLVSDYFKAWNTNDNKIMAAIHWNSPDMTFYGPTVDTAFLTKGWDITAEGLKNAFDSPVGTYSLSCHDPKIWLVDKNVAIVTMYVIWNITDQNTKEEQLLQVRGTQVVKRINGKWKIVHVHWSALPK